MAKYNLTEYADVLYGSGETDRFFNDGLASKWFYIKALCGNTSPAAALPFGKMSVGAYSGGYPTGYGTHCPNSCGKVRKFSDVHRIRGFSHIHQSGTGGIKYYYNYAVTTPFCGELSRAFEYRDFTDERAEPGYYSVKLGDIKCELTVDGGVAVHRYRFADFGARVAVDFSNDGLSKLFGERFYSYVKEPALKTIENGVLCTGIFSGVKLSFAVVADTPARVSLFADGRGEIGDTVLIEDNKKPFGAVFDTENREITLRVAYSTECENRAIDELRRSVEPFDAVRIGALEIWERALSHFEIETSDEDMKIKFYSNLYHSLVKPVYMSGESVLGVENAVTDFATLWDQYKTNLPLIYLSYPEMSERIATSLINVSRARSYIPCSFALSDILPCEEQARCLGIITLTDAYRMCVGGVDREAIDECMRRELMRADIKELEEEILPERYTHILDVSDAALSVADLTDDTELKKRLLSLGKKMTEVYSSDGLLSQKSVYYEGDRYTYSFRLHRDMEARIAIAGGEERFCEMLDSFFGFSGDSVEPIFASDEYELFDNAGHHRFQGFNNECDMETPYAYVFAGRHDRLEEIVRECVSRCFGIGRSALPGNNDTGGLSSMFVWNSLGIFPAAGRGEFLIGTPSFDRAVISVGYGRKLEIVAYGREGGEKFRVDRVLFNSKPVDDYRIDFSDIASGGKLEFYMK